MPGLISLAVLCWPLQMCCPSLTTGCPCKPPCPSLVSVFKQPVNPPPAPPAQKCAAKPLERWHRVSPTRCQWCKPQPALSWSLGIAMIWTNSSGSPWRDGNHILFGTIQSSEPIQTSLRDLIRVQHGVWWNWCWMQQQRKWDETWGQSERTCISIGQLSSETLGVHCKRYKNKRQMALSWLIKVGFAVVTSPSNNTKVKEKKSQRASDSWTSNPESNSGLFLWTCFPYYFSTAV